MQVDWKFAGIWNDSLLTYAERPIKYRDYMYASELGGSYIDRYLKMLGTKPTNPPNNRSLRKFQAGNVWESIVGFVLLRAGIVKARQVRAKVELPGCIPVSGRLDFVAGGAMDWERAERELSQLDSFLSFFPEFLRYACTEIIEKLKTEYQGKEFLEKILEVKSVGSFVFERAKKARVANPNHLLQNFHYLIGEQEDGSKYDFGQIIYVSRDDCRLLEFPVYSTAMDLRQKYEEDVRKMTEYFVYKELPPKEPEIFFDEDACRFSKNWKVEYSYYLTKLYKYKEPKEYRDKYVSMCSQFNRVFKRVVEGKPMTDLNKKVIKDIKKAFPRFDDYVIMAKERGVLELVEEEIDD